MKTSPDTKEPTIVVDRREWKAALDAMLAVYNKANELVDVVDRLEKHLRALSQAGLLMLALLGGVLAACGGDPQRIFECQFQCPGALRVCDRHKDDGHLWRTCTCLIYDVSFRVDDPQSCAGGEGLWNQLCLGKN